MPESRTVVLLPTYNEAGNLEPMLQAIHEVLPAAHILVVDDNSPDGTGLIADRAAAADPRVHVAHRPGKQGLGVAYRWAYRWALDEGYDYILQIDCDFSHNPKDLATIRKLLEEHPAVIGSRRVEGGGTAGWSKFRNFVSKSGSFYARTILGSPVQDLTAGFKGFRKEALAKLDLGAIRSDGYGFQIEVTTSLIALGVKVVETPIWFTDRRVGQSKMSTKIFVEAMWKVWQIRARAKELAQGSGPRHTG
jgi:dolichol-phosphate mannosyltransferase